YSTQARCQRWQGWRFRKGNIHLNGHQALIYSRVRVNQLSQGESDVTRGERQQAVLQAISSKLASFGTFVQLPFIGGDPLHPLPRRSGRDVSSAAEASDRRALGR